MPSPRARGRRPTPKGGGRGRGVLVVEDEPAVRKMLVRILQDAGYEVRAAGDGRTALREVDTARPDLLIVDIMMPELDGVALVRAVKNRRETSRIPVIFLTGKSDPRSMLEGIDAGARYYVTKPFDVDDVLAKVETALRP